MKEWHVKRSTYLIDNPWIKIRQDDIQTGGQDIAYFIIEERNGGMIAAVTEQEELLFVKSFKPAINKEVLELPTGYFETTDNSPLEGMRRELEEETGYVAQKIQPLGITYRSPGRYTQELHLFLARDLAKKSQKLDQIEQGLEVVLIPLVDAINMVVTGQLQDLATITTVLLVNQKLRLNS